MMKRIRRLATLLCLALTAPVAGCYPSALNWPEYDRARRSAPADDPTHPLLGAWEGTYGDSRGAPRFLIRAVLSTQPAPGLCGDTPLPPDAYSVEVRAALPGATWWQSFWSNVVRFDTWFELARMREYKGITMLQSPYRGFVAVTGWSDGVSLTLKYVNNDPDWYNSWELHLQRPAADAHGMASGPADRGRSEGDRSLKKGHAMTTRSLKMLSLACLIGVGLLLASVSAAPPASAPTTRKAVGQIAEGASPPSEEAWNGALRLPGTVRARSAAVGPAVDGVVTGVKCDLGRAVKEGELLFQLDDIVARAQLAVAQAQYKVVRTRAEHYEQASKGTVSADERRESIAQRDAAAAEVAVRQAALQQTRVVAPFAGVVAERNADVGDVVKTGAPLATIIQLDALRVSVDVPQSAYPRVQVGQAVRVRCDVLSGGYVAGKVALVSPNLDPSTRTGVVQVAVGNADGKLKPGMYVEVQILVHHTASEAPK
jgi:RND family efflux transporter MFP subunit